MEYAVLMVFNAGDDIEFQLPPAPDGQKWCHEIDTSAPDMTPGIVTESALEIAGQSVSALVLVSDG